MTDRESLIESAELLIHIKDDVRVRLIKFVKGVKKPKDVTLYWQNGGGAIAIRDSELGTRDSWEVYFDPDGSFSVNLHFRGRSDGRIKRALKALGEME